MITLVTKRATAASCREVQMRRQLAEFIGRVSQLRGLTSR